MNGETGSSQSRQSNIRTGRILSKRTIWQRRRSNWLRLHGALQNSTPVMRVDKSVVATHEAGHALVILATPFRNYILGARIFLDNGDWRGEVHTDRGRSKVDPIRVI